MPLIAQDAKTVSLGQFTCYCVSDKVVFTNTHLIERRTVYELLCAGYVLKVKMSDTAEGALCDTLEQVKPSTGIVSEEDSGGGVGGGELAE